MTQEHPITPPPELVSKWCYEDGEEIKSSPRWFFSVCAKAAQWGADQELEACVDWLSNARNHTLTWNEATNYSANLRAARRPKPPSLKEQALEVLDDAKLDAAHYNILLRALEQLSE
jgi:hypothetical protein